MNTTRSWASKSPRTLDRAFLRAVPALRRMLWRKPSFKTSSDASATFPVSIISDTGVGNRPSAPAAQSSFLASLRTRSYSWADRVLSSDFLTLALPRSHVREVVEQLFLLFRRQVIDRERSHAPMLLACLTLAASNDIASLFHQSLVCNTVNPGQAVQDVRGGLRDSTVFKLA